MTDPDDNTVQPAIVLVAPQMGENIGAAARAMLNFGLDRMRIVNPRDGWPNPAAKAMASGAGRVLDGAQVVATTAEAVADCNFVYATTARMRGLTKDVFAPTDAMADARARTARGEKVAILFGPERAGLENDDIIRANALITVPVNPAFASLNLAQSVLLLAYEWGRQAPGAQVPETSESRTRAANAREMDVLAETFETALDARGFFWPDHKAEPMKRTLRNMFSRLSLTDMDVRTLHGILKALTRRKPD